MGSEMCIRDSHGVGGGVHPVTAEALQHFKEVAAQSFVLASLPDKTVGNGLAFNEASGNDYDGHLYRWPLVADVGLLYWRTDLMDQPPATPDALVKVAGRLVESQTVANGFVWQGRQYEGLSCDFLEVLQGFGGDWMDTTTNAMELDSPCLLYTSPSPRDLSTSRMPSSA